MAKIRITARGRIYGDQGKDMYDEVIEVKSLDDIPSGWDDAYVIERADKKAAAEPVTNPDEKSDDKKSDDKKDVSEPAKQTLDLTKK